MAVPDVAVADRTAKGGAREELPTGPDGHMPMKHRERREGPGSGLTRYLGWVRC